MMHVVESVFVKQMCEEIGLHIETTRAINISLQISQLIPGRAIPRNRYFFDLQVFSNGRNGVYLFNINISNKQAARAF